MPRIALLILLLFGSVAWADELRTLGGKTVTGTMTRISDAEIVLKTDTGDVATPLAQVLAVDLKAGAGVGLVKYTDLRLVDDTVLHCKSVTVKRKDVEALLPSGLTVKLPLASVVALNNDAGNKELKKKWDELARPKLKRDRLIILRDDELNLLEGVLGEADAEGKTIQFKRDGADAAVPVLLEKAYGLVFWRPD